MWETGSQRPETGPPRIGSAFDAFKNIYNTERPHEALNQTSPAYNYQQSPRQFDGRLRAPEYPSHFKVRRVRNTGQIKWKGDLIFVSGVLERETVDGLCDPRWLLRADEDRIPNLQGECVIHPLCLSVTYHPGRTWDRPWPERWRVRWGAERGNCRGGI